MEKENRFYVYAYLDPRKPGNYCYKGLDICFLYEPFYVGKGGTKKQIKRHLFESAVVTRNILKYNKIHKIIKEYGEIPFVISVCGDLYENEALKLENELIKKIGRINMKTGSLTNIIENSVGGTSNPSKETRFKLGKATRGKTYEEIYGKEKAIELKKKRSESNKNRTVSQKVKEGMVKRNLKTWRIIKPDGENIITEDLKKFCNQNNLCTTLMWSVANGKQTHHKQWKCFYHNSTTI